MKERPDDVQGWSLLARSYAATGKPDKALAAYAHLAKIAPEDASVLADYADALAMSRGRNLSGEPFELVMRALKADPRHPKALALAGTATLNSGDFAASMGYWERLYAVVPPGSEDAAQVAGVIEEVREPRRRRRKAPAALQGTRRSGSPPAVVPAGQGRRAASPDGHRPAAGAGQGRRRQERLGHREARRRARRQDLAHRHPLHLRAGRDRLAHSARDPARRRGRTAEGLRARRLDGDVAGREALRPRPRWSSRRASRRPAAR